MSARYFDHAATTGMCPSALKAMQTALEAHYANPSSPHQAGRDARKILEDTRAGILNLLACSDGQLVFCSGASEANNQVIQHALQRWPDKNIVCAGNVHSCISWLGAVHPQRYKRVAVNKHAQLTVSALNAVLDDNCGLVCLTHVCHETGAIQDIEALTAACVRHGIPCLVDGTQAVGHIAVHVDGSQADWYTWSAHKFGGATGLGGMCVQGQELLPLIRGGTQEHGMRAGTENIAAAVAAHTALAEANTCLTERLAHLEQCRAQLHNGIKEFCPQAIFPGATEHHYPGICACTLPGIEARIFIEALSIEGFYIASGSACTADSLQPSSVLLDTGLTADEALATVRVSFNHESSLEHIYELVQAMRRQYRQQCGGY